MEKRVKFIALTLGFSLLTLGACRSGNQANTAQQPATAANNSESAGTGAGSGSRRGARRASSSSSQSAQSAPAAAAPPPPRIVTVPAGTVVAVTLGSAINTGTTQSGSTFSGTLAAPLRAGGTDVAPTGSAVQGQVTNVVSSGRLNRPAELSLVLTSIKPPGGSAYNISTTTWSETGASKKKRDVVAIGGGAGLGALVGAIAGHGKGAAIGALVGAGAGTAGAALTGKKEIVLPAETRIDFKLSKPLQLQQGG